MGNNSTSFPTMLYQHASILPWNEDLALSVHILSLNVASIDFNRSYVWLEAIIPHTTLDSLASLKNLLLQQTQEGMFAQAIGWHYASVLLVAVKEACCINPLGTSIISEGTDHHEFPTK